MTRLLDITKKIRSKNAGPFWLTIDIFFDDTDTYQALKQHLKTDAVAALFAMKATDIKRFDIDDLLVIKFSLPRPHIQGTARDTDMHGASFAALLEEMVVTL